MQRIRRWLRSLADNTSSWLLLCTAAIFNMEPFQSQAFLPGNVSPPHVLAAVTSCVLFPVLSSAVPSPQIRMEFDLFKPQLYPLNCCCSHYCFLNQTVNQSEI
jgi:hypothetical protein